jgi:hypothetical protein
VIEPRSLITGSKRVDHWTGESVYECSEIAGSPQLEALFGLIANCNLQAQIRKYFFLKKRLERHFECLTGCQNIIFLTDILMSSSKRSGYGHSVCTVTSDHLKLGGLQFRRSDSPHSEPPPSRVKQSTACGGSSVGSALCLFLSGLISGCAPGLLPARQGIFRPFVLLPEVFLWW